MDKDDFVTLKIKRETAKDFRKYSKELGKQQSETLQLMLEFFRANALSPLEDMGPNMKTLEKRIKGRINSVIAILREIEKTQTKPSLAMLQLLFQEKPSGKKGILVEKNSRTPE